MFAKARTAVAVLKLFGPGWVFFRLRYAAALKLGVMRRRTPVRPWTARPLAGWLADPALAETDRYAEYRAQHAPRFLFRPSDRVQYASLLAGFDSGASGPVQQADRLAQGEWQWFGGIPVQTSTPPDWHRNALTGQRAPADQHWSELGDFAFGDIKAIWEPSRFGAAYLLVRAAWRTGEEHYAELFWRLVEDWRAANPPALGANWKCGQETSLRLMAWCFGLYGLSDFRATTPVRVVLLAELVAESAARVEANITYALSQSNNHGVSEAVGLFTAGSLFPEFAAAARWRARGRALLERLAGELIYDDGAFSQHSMNYERLMLHDYIWALRLAELQEQPFSDVLRTRVSRAVQFLYQLQDDSTGHLPNYGANDGSLILPLSGCEPRDYRPLLQAAHYCCTGQRLYGPGVWDEEALWLCGPSALAAQPAALERAALWAESGGYYTIRRPSGFAFVRAARFRHRPGHADQLHTDLWWRGHNVALDAGTFGYNADAPWAADFERTGLHNTVMVDGRDQANKISRFLTYPWSKGRACSARPEAAQWPVAYWEGEHDAYHQLATPVTHGRALIGLADDAWVIIDRLQSAQQHDYRLHWLLPDAPHAFDQETPALTLNLAAGDYYVRVGAGQGTARCSIVRADRHSARGWRAPGYGRREPAISLAAEVTAATTWLYSIFSARPLTVQRRAEALELSSASWRARIGVDPTAARLATVDFVQSVGE